MFNMLVELFGYRVPDNSQRKSIRKSVELFGFNVPDELKAFLRKAVSDVGGKVERESWSTETDKLNIKVFYNPASMDVIFLRNLASFILHHSPIKLEQYPQLWLLKDRIVFGSK